MSSRAKRCKAARNSAGLRQADAAEKLNKSIATIKSWEREGGSEPNTLGDVASMCRLYGMSIDYYINGRENSTQLTKEEQTLLSDYRMLPTPYRELVSSVAGALAKKQNA